MTTSSTPPDSSSSWLQQSSTPKSGRAKAAIALWLVALVPFATIGFGLTDPTAAGDAYRGVQGILRAVLPILAVLVVVGLLTWPTVRPAVALWFRRVRMRMSVDRTPLYRALERLRNFETAQDHLDAGRKLIDMGRPEQAAPHLKRAIELDPEFLAARYVTGITALKLGYPEPAAQHLQVVIEREPEHGFGTAMLSYGVALAGMGRAEQAEQVLAEHERRHGPNRRADRLRARMALARGDEVRSKELLERAARPLESGAPTTPEEKLERARARVDLWLGIRSTNARQPEGGAA